jgi:hypothetical protein
VAIKPGAEASVRALLSLPPIEIDDISLILKGISIEGENTLMAGLGCIGKSSAGNLKHFLQKARKLTEVIMRIMWVWRHNNPWRRNEGESCCIEGALASGYIHNRAK